MKINPLVKGLMVLVLVKVIVLGSMFMPRAEVEQAALEPNYAAVTVLAQAGNSGPSYVLLESQNPVAAVEVTVQPVEPAPAASVAEPAQTSALGGVVESALGVTRLLGAGIAHAQSMPVPDTGGYTGLLTPTPTLGGSDMPIPSIPVPDVGDFVSRDSAAAKQAELNRREQELMALQQQMESRMTELYTLENRLQGMIDSANTTQESKFSSLVSMYANMKPRVAAEALSSMDQDIAVRILTGLKSTESGEIMSYMEPLVAARLSEAMTKMQF